MSSASLTGWLELIIIVIPVLMLVGAVPAFLGVCLLRFVRCGSLSQIGAVVAVGMLVSGVVYGAMR